ncbi:MAG: hypothetical protein HZB67_01205 [Candidatus Aenigmarchaeota archaeon]|nr:hypothetical protein [Candidatus Aenigmarchaeota archaeon]
MAAFSGVKFNAARQAELKARADFFSKKTKNPAAWVKLPINARERFQIRLTSPETFQAVEKEAARLKLGKDGVRRILDTLWPYSVALKGSWEEVRPKVGELQRSMEYLDPDSKSYARHERIIEIIYWAEKLPAETKSELLDLVRAAKK